MVNYIVTVPVINLFLLCSKPSLLYLVTVELDPSKVLLHHTPQCYTLSVEGTEGIKPKDHSSWFWCSSFSYHTVVSGVQGPGITHPPENPPRPSRWLHSAIHRKPRQFPAHQHLSKLLHHPSSKTRVHNTSFCLFQKKYIFKAVSKHLTAPTLGNLCWSWQR